MELLLLLFRLALSKTCRQSCPSSPSTPMTAGLSGRAHSQQPAPSSQQPGFQAEGGRSSPLPFARWEGGLWLSGRAPLSTAMISSCHGPRATGHSQQHQSRRGLSGSAALRFLAPDFPCNRRPLRHRLSDSLDTNKSRRRRYLSRFCRACEACSSFRIPTRHRDLHGKFF